MAASADKNNQEGTTNEGNNDMAVAMMTMMCAACAVQTPSNDKDKSSSSSSPPPGINRANIDPTANRNENFYRWANGNWMKQNPIPPGYPSWNTFLALHTASQEQCKALLEELLLKQQQQLQLVQEDTSTPTEHKMTDDEAKIAAFYAAAMNEEAIEAAGVLKPIQPILDLIQQIIVDATNVYNNSDKNKQKTMSSSLAQGLGTLASQFGIYAFFNTSASPDNAQASHTLCQISQGGLGLPDRDYYTDEDKAEIRQAYVQHVAKMLSFLDEGNHEHGQDTVSPQFLATAEAILKVETELAQAHLTRTENRDPHVTYNKMTLEDLMERADHAFDFIAYFAGSTQQPASSVSDSLGHVNVRNVQALVTAARVCADLDPSTLRAYLQWHAVHSLAPYLTRAVVQENFDFYETKLAGTKEMKPRWKRCMGMVEQALGEILGQLYCARHFEESAKTRALHIVDNVRQALEERLREVPWITAEETRQQALKKMEAFRVKIGYPNKWIDYTPLTFGLTDSFVEMVCKARAFAHKRQVDEMNAPTDREKWVRKQIWNFSNIREDSQCSFLRRLTVYTSSSLDPLFLRIFLQFFKFMTPQTVNAYFHPNMNEIVFPAAILQSPFFDPAADDAVNYGSMGAVVGHEMTHGYGKTMKRSFMCLECS